MTQHPYPSQKYSSREFHWWDVRSWGRGTQDVILKQKDVTAAFRNGSTDPQDLFRRAMECPRVLRVEVFAQLFSGH
ncbi:hypothetical protein CLCR_02196 [Cladophialophora carrionii]|uniref:Uncharacterized protein n=1 Tax=Cladophialophora carrionii TaxID=86049 RepID=A0A1C1CE07_9EURO|nr:hypothetical protein CLCR_02196 [Cladophialophora carrionii]